MLKDDLAIAKREAKRMCQHLGDSAVVDGIMLWMTVAVILVVFVPVLAAVLSSTPAISDNSPLNATQSSLTTMVGNSYGLLIVVLIILAAVILLGVIAYLRGRQ